jgi:D-alanine--D-alanine ligase
MRTPQEIQTAFSPREAMDGSSRFFLVGIGGAGMSALARMLHALGIPVAGTDSTETDETNRLRAEGIDVIIGHSGEALRAFATEKTAVVLTDAIDLKINPEVAAARELNLNLFRRSQLLGWLLKARRVIAVTGTHGKTTTTGMLGSGLTSAGFDPLVIVGANIPAWRSPVLYGKGEWAVVEACEAYDSFHDLDPEIVILTNLELDHVDFHGTWENLKSSVGRFVSKIPATGALVYCQSDPGAAEIAEAFSGKTVPYSEAQFPSTIARSTSGDHNLSNAAGALSAAIVAGADTTLAAHGIAAFTGAERRLEVLQDGEIAVVDDYAHHPTEIAASIQAIRARFPNRRVVVAFQPHLYSRTEGLIPEFAAALSSADEVVLTDIYPARENPIPGVSAARIAELVTVPVRYVPSRHLLPRKVASWLKPGDVAVGMGAGNISAFAPALISELQRGKSSARHVWVAYGGDSAEREVSILSGRAVAKALRERGHLVDLVDVSELLLSKGDLSKLIGPNRPDAVFLAVHGTNSEDGAMQGLLETLHVPYTGSGIQSSAIAMDKNLTKQILEREGIRVPKGVHVTSATQSVDLTGPVVVKPNAQGSTVGLSFVSDPAEVPAAIARSLSYDASVLVEEWITGMEISVPVLIDEALPPVEIAPASGKYDFASKYTVGATEEVCPARLSESALAESQRIALAAHRALGCRGATRTDIMVRDPHGAAEMFVLEVNTLPGMTGTSLFPNSARTAGIPFDDLCERILLDALRSHETTA